MNDDGWTFNLRSCFADADDSDADGEDTAPAPSDDFADLDLSTRPDEAAYKPTPWSIAKINAATRAMKPQEEGPTLDSTSKDVTAASDRAVDVATNSQNAGLVTNLSSPSVSRPPPTASATAPIRCEPRRYPRPKPAAAIDRSQTTLRDAFKVQAARAPAAKYPLKPGEVMGQKITATPLPLVKGQGARTMLAGSFLAPAMKEGRVHILPHTKPPGPRPSAQLNPPAYTRSKLEFRSNQTHAPDRLPDSGRTAAPGPRSDFESTPSIVSQDVASSVEGGDAHILSGGPFGHGNDFSSTLDSGSPAYMRSKYEFRPSEAHTSTPIGGFPSGPQHSFASEDMTLSRTPEVSDGPRGPHRPTAREEGRPANDSSPVLHPDDPDLADLPDFDLYLDGLEAQPQPNDDSFSSDQHILSSDSLLSISSLSPSAGRAFQAFFPGPSRSMSRSPLSLCKVPNDQDISMTTGAPNAPLRPFVASRYFDLGPPIASGSISWPDREKRTLAPFSTADSEEEAYVRQSLLTQPTRVQLPTHVLHPARSESARAPKGPIPAWLASALPKPHTSRLGESTVGGYGADYNAPVDEYGMDVDDARVYAGPGIDDDVPMDAYHDAPSALVAADHCHPHPQHENHEEYLETHSQRRSYDEFERRVDICADHEKYEDVPSSPTMVNSSPPPARPRKAIASTFGSSPPRPRPVQRLPPRPRPDLPPPSTPPPRPGPRQPRPADRPAIPAQPRDAYAFGAAEADDPDAEWTTLPSRKKARASKPAPGGCCGIRQSGKFKLKIPFGGGGGGSKLVPDVDAKRDGQGMGGSGGGNTGRRVVVYVPPPRVLSS